MFTLHILRNCDEKNSINISLKDFKKVVTVGVNQFYSFVFLFLINFLDIYINAKYK